MRDVITFPKFFECLRIAGYDPFDDTLFYIRKAVQAFVPQHGIRDDTLFAHSLKRSCTDFEQVGKFIAREPDFRLPGGIRLFLEDVIGDTLDFVFQILVHLVIECYDFHDCSIFRSYAAKVYDCKTILSIVGTDYGKIFRRNGG